MRTDMLFIDGELVDLDEDTQITLNIKSNLFTDLSKIVSNNSYTIKLPKTVRNQRIIEHADLPACDTDYPREYHQARYFRTVYSVCRQCGMLAVSYRRQPATDPRRHTTRFVHLQSACCHPR